MPRKPINFELDFMIKYIFPRFTVKQFDDVSFNIKPLNQGLDYDTTGMIGKIFVGVNNDMFMQTTNIAVSSNNINVLLDKNMLQKSGRAYAEIELTDKAGTITSSSFIFDIDPKIGEGGMIPGEYEGFVEKYERLIAEFKSQVNSSVNSANSLVNDVIKKCNTNVDNKLNTVDGLINAKISDIEKRFNNITASKQQDAEVIDARNGETSLKARLERDLANTNRELEKIKKLEESTVSTVTTDKAFTTIAETTNGYFEDVKIEGKTLVNLCNSANIGFSIESMYYCKPLTTYTIYFIAGDGEGQVNYHYKNISDKTHGDTKLYHNETSASKIILTTIRTKEDTKNICFYSPDDKVKFTNLLILEGDYTDKDVTFFEGLKSVGQDTGGIVVSSANESLFDGKFELGGLDDNGNLYNNEAFIRSAFIRLKRDVTYTFLYEINDSTLKGVVIHLYDINKKHIKDLGWYKTYTPSEDCYIRFKIRNNSHTKLTQTDLYMVNSTFKLEVVNAPTQYTEPKQDKKQILYYNPTTQTWEKPVLREWDSIEKHSDGKYYYHKRSEEIVLNGSENWNDSSVVSTDTVRFVISLGDNKHNIAPICDIFKGQLYTTNDVQGAFIGNSTNLAISILKSKLSTQDVTGFKQWLQANNVTVVYQLAKEEVYECTNLDLVTYSNETNLIVNSGAIQPKITLKVLSNISNVVKLLQEKVSILENKFITGLKQVLAGDMMSLAYLLYPQDFDKDNEVKTLEEL